jgi:hypothetical protein
MLSSLTIIYRESLPSFFRDSEEYPHHLGVEHTIGTKADRLACCGERPRKPVRPVGRDGIQSIRYGEVSRAERDLVSLEATRVARSIVTLVVRENDFGCVSKKGYVL